MNKNKINLIISILVGIGAFLPMWMRYDDVGISYARLLYNELFINSGNDPLWMDALVFLTNGMPFIAIFGTVILYIFYYFEENEKYIQRTFILYIVSLIILLIMYCFVLLVVKLDLKPNTFFYLYHILYSFLGIRIYLEKKNSYKAESPTLNGFWSDMWSDIWVSKSGWGKFKIVFATVLTSFSLIFGSKYLILPNHIYKIQQTNNDLTLETLEIGDNKTYLTFTYGNTPSDAAFIAYLKDSKRGNSKVLCLLAQSRSFLGIKASTKSELLDAIELPNEGYMGVNKLTLVFNRINYLYYTGFDIVFMKGGEEEYTAFSNIKIENW
jgi:hypothetical protein